MNEENGRRTHEKGRKRMSALDNQRGKPRENGEEGKKKGGDLRRKSEKKGWGKNQNAVFTRFQKHKCSKMLPRGSPQKTCILARKRVSGRQSVG